MISIRTSTARAVTMTLIALASLIVPSLADVIHLKNGGSVTADSWQVRDDSLVIHQGIGTIVIPRSDVARIEKVEPVVSAPTPVETPEISAGTPPPLPAPIPPVDARASGKPSREDILTQIDLLRRRLRNATGNSREDTAQIITLLNYLGGESYTDRDLPEALTRFREAQSYDPRHAMAQLGLAATYFALGQDLHARSILESAVLDHPENPDLHVLLGDVYYSQERLDEALAIWEKALSLKSDDRIRQRVEKLRRERAVDQDYRRAEAVHFTLKYDGEMSGPDLGQEILDYLEGQFPALVSRFDYYPRQPLIVIVYPSRQFHEVTLTDQDVGGLFDGKIRVPSGGLKQLNAEARAVLLHELAHAFIAGKSQGTAPRWLHEGIAQLVEGRRAPRGVGIELARDFKARGGAQSWGTKFSYPSSLSFVEFLERREGFYRLIELLEAMARGVSAEVAFEEVTRYSLAELRQAWGKALVQAHLQ